MAVGDLLLRRQSAALTNVDNTAESTASYDTEVLATGDFSGTSTTTQYTVPAAHDGLLHLVLYSEYRRSPSAQRSVGISQVRVNTTNQGLRGASGQFYQRLSGGSDDAASCAAALLEPSTSDTIEIRRGTQLDGSNRIGNWDSNLDDPISYTIAILPDVDRLYATLTSALTDIGRIGNTTGSNVDWSTMPTPQEGSVVQAGLTLDSSQGATYSIVGGNEIQISTAGTHALLVAAQFRNDTSDRRVGICIIEVDDGAGYAPRFVTTAYIRDISSNIAVATLPVAPIVTENTNALVRFRFLQQAEPLGLTNTIDVIGLDVQIADLDDASWVVATEDADLAVLDQTLRPIDYTVDPEPRKDSGWVHATTLSIGSYAQLCIDDGAFYFYVLETLLLAGANLVASSAYDGAVATGASLNGSGLINEFNDALEGNSFIIDMDNSTAINVGGPFTAQTIEAIIRIDDTSTLQCLYEQGGSARGFSLAIDSGSLVVSAWNNETADGPGDGWGQGGTVNDPVSASVSIPSTGTYYIAASYEQESSDDTFDGVLAVHIGDISNVAGGLTTGSTTGSGTAGSGGIGKLYGHTGDINWCQNADAFIGAAGALTTPAAFDGAINAIAFYDGVALSAATLLTHFQASDDDAAPPVAADPSRLRNEFGATIRAITGVAQVWGRQIATSGTRKTPTAQLIVDGAAMPYGVGSEYSRGQQGSIDTYAAGFGAASGVELADSSYICWGVFDHTTNTSGDIRINSGLTWANTAWAIRIDDLGTSNQTVILSLLSEDDTAYGIQIAPIGVAVDLVGEDDTAQGITAQNPLPAWRLCESVNITASGEDTTAQLTAPTGKTTSAFGGGRIQDDENPGDAVDLTASEYREDEWAIESTVDADTGVVYEFRVVIDGIPSDTISVTPEITITEGTNVAVDLVSEDDTAFDPTANAGAVTVAVGVVQEDDTALTPTALPQALTVSIPVILEDDTALTLTPAAQEVSVAIPLVSEDDTAYAPTAAPQPVTVSIPVILEDDTALNVFVDAGGAGIPLVLVTEDDSAHAPTAATGAVTVSLGLTLEDDTALAFTVAGTIQVGIDLAGEEDQALAPTVALGALTYPLAIVEEDDTAFTVSSSGSVNVAIPLVTENNTAHLLTVGTGTLSIGCALAMEENEAFFVSSVPSAFSAVLSLASEDDTGLTLTPVPGSTSVSVPFTQEEDQAFIAVAVTIAGTLLAHVTEDATAFTVLPVFEQSIAVGLVFEGDTVFPPGVAVGPTFVDLVIVLEDDSVFPVALSQGATQVSVDLVSENDTALDPVVVVGSTATPISVTTELDTASSPTPAPGALTAALVLISEDDTVFATTAAQVFPVALEVVSEEDTTFDPGVATGPTSIALTEALEEDTAFTVFLTGLTSGVLTRAEEVDSAHPPPVVLAALGVSLVNALELDFAPDPVVAPGPVTATVDALNELDTAYGSTPGLVNAISLLALGEIDSAPDPVVAPGPVTNTLDSVGELDTALVVESTPVNLVTLPLVEEVDSTLDVAAAVGQLSLLLALVLEIDAPFDITAFREFIGTLPTARRNTEPHGVLAGGSRRAATSSAGNPHGVRIEEGGGVGVSGVSGLTGVEGGKGQTGVD